MRSFLMFIFLVWLFTVLFAPKPDIDGRTGNTIDSEAAKNDKRIYRRPWSIDKEDL